VPGGGIARDGERWINVSGGVDPALFGGGARAA
jgi:hypothetical protein